MEEELKIQNQEKSNKEESKLKWGDEIDEEEENNEPDENGIKTVIEYKTNSQGQKIKIIKKVKSYKQVKRRWKKFGLVADKPPGPEMGVTTIGDEVPFIIGQKQEKNSSR